MNDLVAFYEPYNMNQETFFIYQRKYWRCVCFSVTIFHNFILFNFYRKLIHLSFMVFISHYSYWSHTILSQRNLLLSIFILVGIFCTYTLTWIKFYIYDISFKNLIIICRHKPAYNYRIWNSLHLFVFLTSISSMN